jgi:hypothetical protein
MRSTTSSQISESSLIFEERTFTTKKGGFKDLSQITIIFECEKISIVGYIDTVQWVSTSGSGSLTVLFCGTICHEAMCDGT